MLSHTLQRIRQATGYRVTAQTSSGWRLGLRLGLFRDRSILVRGRPCHLR